MAGAGPTCCTDCSPDDKLRISSYQQGTRRVLFRRVGNQIVFYGENEASEIVRSFRGRRSRWSQSAADTQVLARNLGILEVSGRHAHHLVLGDINTAAADQARDLLRRYQIDINSAVNGVSLTENHHLRTGLHRHRTVELVNQRLQAAIEGITDWTHARLEILEELRRLRGDILSRGFPP